MTDTTADNAALAAGTAVNAADPDAWTASKTRLTWLMFKPMLRFVPLLALESFVGHEVMALLFPTISDLAIWPLALLYAGILALAMMTAAEKYRRRQWVQAGIAVLAWFSLVVVTTYVRFSMTDPDVVYADGFAIGEGAQDVTYDHRGRVAIALVTVGILLITGLVAFFTTLEHNPFIQARLNSLRAAERAARHEADVEAEFERAQRGLGNVLMKRDALVESLANELEALDHERDVTLQLVALALAEKLQDPRTHDGAVEMAGPIAGTGDAVRDVLERAARLRAVRAEKEGGHHA